jgi:hypothetical protein
MAPRGLRNCNPLNLENDGTPWLGAVPNPSEPRFVTFESMVYGIRAAARVLLNYQEKHHLATLTQIITRWAPPNENNTASYIAHVAQLTGISPDEPRTFRLPVPMGKLIRAMCIHENGSCPITDDEMRQGLKLAGIDTGDAPPDFSNVITGVESTAPKIGG